MPMCATLSVCHAPWMPASSAVLAGQPDHVSAVRFLNYEGQPEAVDLVNRFEQVPDASAGSIAVLRTDASALHPHTACGARRRSPCSAAISTTSALKRTSIAVGSSSGTTRPSCCSMRTVRAQCV